MFNYCTQSKVTEQIQITSNLKIIYLIKLISTEAMKHDFERKTHEGKEYDKGNPPHCSIHSEIISIEQE